MSNKKGPLEKELTMADPICDMVERNKDHITKVRRVPGGTEVEQLCQRVYSLYYYLWHSNPKIPDNP